MHQNTEREKHLLSRAEPCHAVQTQRLSRFGSNKLLEFARVMVGNGNRVFSPVHLIIVATKAEIIAAMFIFQSCKIPSRSTGDYWAVLWRPNSMISYSNRTSCVVFHVSLVLSPRRLLALFSCCVCFQSKVRHDCRNCTANEFTCQSIQHDFDTSWFCLLVSQREHTMDQNQWD